jgi:N-acetylglucosaminyl-diphospho-decaprenol L-rhamnosyltransferase
MGSPVLIVIVNYRTAGLAIDCLKSIADEIPSCPSIRATVVDNDSRDGSVERLSAAIAENRWGRWAGLIPSGRNGGFAAGNNVAIRQELARDATDRARYVLLLNPDTVLRPGAVAALSGFMDDRPEVGVAGSRIEDSEGRVQGSARHFPSPLGEFLFTARVGPLTRLFGRHAVVMAEGDRPMKCDWVSGAAMMIRTELFPTLGLMDEGYFLYFEEIDFCRRAASAGWEAWFVPASRVVHFEGASTGIRDRTRRRPRYWYESRRRYFLKACGPWGLGLADGLWAAGRVIWTTQKLSGLVACRDEDPRGFAADLLGGDWRALASGRWREIPRTADSGAADLFGTRPEAKPS